LGPTVSIARGRRARGIPGLVGGPSSAPLLRARRRRPCHVSSAPRSPPSEEGPPRQRAAAACEPPPGRLSSLGRRHLSRGQSLPRHSTPLSAIDYRQSGFGVACARRACVAAPARTTVRRESESKQGTRRHEIIKCDWPRESFKCSLLAAPRAPLPELGRVRRRRHGSLLSAARPGHTRPTRCARACAGFRPVPYHAAAGRYSTLFCPQHRRSCTSKTAIRPRREDVARSPARVRRLRPSRKGTCHETMIATATTTTTTTTMALLLRDETRRREAAAAEP
jgi:hypothetical protein